VRVARADALTMAGASGLAWLVAPSDLEWWLVGLVLMAFVAAPHLRLRGPGGSGLDLVMLIGASVPFLFPAPAATVAVVAGGVAAVRLGRSFGPGAGVHPTVDLRRATGSLAYAGILGLGGIPTGSHVGLVPVLVFAAATVAWFLVEMSFRLLYISGRGATSFGYVVGVGVKDFPLIGTLIAGGAVFGLVWQEQPWVALVVGSVPFLITFSSFRRYDDTRITYGQTILALARIPEVGGLSLEGHADRTGRLAVAIGKEMGLRPDRVQTLEYAARMHDIGRITLTEPSVVERGYTDDDIARWSSEIIGEADYLTEAASIVRVHHFPYRRPGQDDDPDQPLEARIVKVASAFDRALHEAGVSTVEALEMLHRGTVYDYDPAVVRSLRVVLGAHPTIVG
jgi:hypothetical protein